MVTSFGIVGNPSNGMMLPNPVIEQEVTLPDGTKDTIKVNAPFTLEEMENAYREQREEVEGDE